MGWCGLARSLNGVMVSVLMATMACTVPPPEATSESAPPAIQETAKEAAVAGARIRVLGTAQDGGFPHAACDCHRCTHAREEPAARRPVAALALVAPPRVFLLDATPDIRPQLAMLADVRDSRGGDSGVGVDRQPVDGVFLTHAHIGHYLGLAFLGFEAIHTQGVPLYGTPAMLDFLQSNGPWDQLFRLGNLRPAPLPPGETVRLEGGVRVTAVAVPHRREYTDTVGFRIEGPRSTVLYIPDCDSWQRWGRGPAEKATIEELLQGVDVALLDGTFYSGDELPGRDLSKIGHPLMVDSMERFEGWSRREGETPAIWFTHFNHSNPVLNPEGNVLREVEERGFGIAREGQEFPL